MKRTCEKCKANEEYGCGLNFKRESITKLTKNGMSFIYYKPLVECPKPITIKEYIKLAMTQLRGSG